MKIYIAADTGPSGFGEASRGVIEHLLRDENINITVRTHQWGVNKKGFALSGSVYPDVRQMESLIRNRDINDNYLLEKPRDIRDRRKGEKGLIDNLGTNQTVSSEDCVVKEFDSQEDIWLSIGPMDFARQAPEHAYSIVSTDYNLDIVPKSWERYIDRVDEVWVPSEWTKSSIENRIGEKEKIKVMPYGVDMKYKPTEYDCSICLHNNGGGSGPGMKCLRDDKFNFLLISRFYHIKGLYRTARAFVEEFTSDEDVRLVVKTTSNMQFQFNPVSSMFEIQKRFGWPNPPEIAPIVQPLQNQYLYDLMGHSDAFLQISRAECFGIAQLQAAYCGTPVIYTDWSAQKEIFDNAGDGFFPVEDYILEKPRSEWPALAFNMPSWPGGPDGDKSYPTDSKWATPSIENIGERMRELYEMDNDTRREYGEKASEFVKESYKWEDKSEKRIQRIKEIL